MIIYYEQRYCELCDHTWHTDCNAPCDKCDEREEEERASREKFTLDAALKAELIEEDEQTKAAMEGYTHFERDSEHGYFTSDSKQDQLIY